MILEHNMIHAIGCGVMKFEKLSITSKQREQYFSARQRGLLNRDDMHVFAILEDEVIQSMAIVARDNTIGEAYDIHDLYLREDADPKYLRELISKLEEACRTQGAYFLICHLQGEAEKTAFYAGLLLDQDYYFTDDGFRLFYAIEELADCRLMETSDDIKNLTEHVIPYKDLTSEQKIELWEIIKKSPDYHVSKTPDPEFGLAAYINGEIVAYMDARKLDDGTVYAPPRYICNRQYDSEARVMIMMYIIEKAKQTMREDTVLICETYNDAVHQQCFDWFGLPEKEDSIIEMIKNI